MMVNAGMGDGARNTRMQEESDQETRSMSYTEHEIRSC